MKNSNSSKSTKKPNAIIEGADSAKQTKKQRKDRTLNKPPTFFDKIQSVLNEASKVGNDIVLPALNAAPNHELSRTQISNKVFGRNTFSGDIVSAWRELEQLEQVEVIEGESKAGRKKTIIRLIQK